MIKDSVKVENDTLIISENPSDSSNIVSSTDTSDFEKILILANLVDIQTIDSSIKVDLKYSGKDNFLGFDIYGDLEKAYLQKEAAEKLAKVQQMLKDTLPEYNLIVFDATRPKSIQKIMWDNFKIPENQKSKYLANPSNASMHSYGIAVDLSIIDGSGKEIDMGTDFDCFEELAYPIFEDKMLANGSLSKEQYDNRHLLRKLMNKAGFNDITTEWWHFSLFGKEVASMKYAVIESHILPKENVIMADIVKMEPIKSDSINISFKIQIKISYKPIPLDSPVFKGLDVWEYFHEGIYKYTTEEFNSIAKAYEYRDKIKSMGFDDCFVAGFNNDQRIGIRDAIDMTE
ncbi:MAG: M15 family metallopeptidase [Bacteroidota bacterium]